MEQIAELLHKAYERKYCGQSLAPDNYDATFKNFISTLNKSQRE